MIIGVIKTRDVILHPLTIISMRGLKGYFKILRRALSWKSYTFIKMIQSSIMLAKKSQSR